jgi:hypothetical protein
MISVRSDESSPANVVHSSVARQLKRNKYGLFVKESSPTPSVVTTTPASKPASGDPPLISLEVTNPVTYFKIWWKKVMSNEGIDFRLRVKPLTAIAIAVAIFSLTFGLGGYVLPHIFSFFRIPIPTNSLIQCP